MYLVLDFWLHHELHFQDTIIPNAGPGHWNDPDMVRIDTLMIEPLKELPSFPRPIELFGMLKLFLMCYTSKV